MKYSSVLRTAVRTTNCVMVASALTFGASADLTIRLPGSVSISRKLVEYRCDAAGGKIGIPSGSFGVEYINAGANSIAVVPIAGNSLIFSNVFSASGARYTTQTYTWWESGSVVTLSSDSLAGKMETSCHRVNK